MVNRSQSKKYFDEANEIIPGGVNSPVRAFGSVGGSPVFMDRGKGAYIWDVDDNRYLDYVASWGPMILGHHHPKVHEAVKTTLENGFSFGTATHLESKLVHKVRGIMPHLDKVRLVSSGTEACMSALRLARGFTGRDKVLKFEGGYHGHADMLLVKAGSGVATLGIPGSPGVPKGATADTVVIPLNDVESLTKVFAELGDQLAAVIIEPIVGNAGFIRPNPEFLPLIRKLCTESGSVLIFDEVMTGFRIAFGGGKEVFGVTPDLTTLGKVIGGGLPIGAFGGRRDIMDALAPVGPVYQAGTLSGNPICAASGLATLEVLESLDYDQLRNHCRTLCQGLRDVAERHGIPLSTDFEGGMFGFFFSKDGVRTFQDATKADIAMFKKFFHGMLDRGFYLAPSAFEAGFISFAHETKDIEATIEAADDVMKEIKAS